MYFLYSCSFARNSSRRVLRSCTFSEIFLLISSFSAMIGPMSPISLLRPSNSSVIASWIFVRPSLSALISALICWMLSFMEEPGSKPLSSASFWFTCATFGRLRFSSWISCRYFFSSLSEIESWCILNSISLIFWSMSASEVKPMDFFILARSPFRAWPSALFSPISPLIACFCVISTLIFSVNSWRWAISSWRFALKTSDPPRRSPIFSDSFCCFAFSASMSSWIFCTAASSPARSGRSMCAVVSSSFLSAFGLALALAFASAATLGAMLRSWGGVVGCVPLQRGLRRHNLP
mmetsp:Transcript_18460/g.47463  ORF Transcript_18460/g.47463 Transcript_18460/m.47463 type:complete len:293 (-) Transcript_18460:17-895(-)